jgi:hypothetical protein
MTGFFMKGGTGDHEREHVASRTRRQLEHLSSGPLTLRELGQGWSLTRDAA